MIGKTIIKRGGGNAMCIFCGGTLKKGKTDYIEKNNNDVVLIRNIPCDACIQCGETYFDCSAIEMIENIIDGMQENTSEIALTVFEYDRSAA